jgi:hypothetical protein
VRVRVPVVVRRLVLGLAISMIAAAALSASGDTGRSDFSQCVQCCVGALRQGLISGSEVLPCARACQAGEDYGVTFCASGP